MIERKVLLREYPIVIQFRFVGIDNEDHRIIMTGSPLANCQTFTLGMACNLQFMHDDEIVDFFTMIHDSLLETTGLKRQMLVDLKASDADVVINKIWNHIEQMHYMPYKSSNGSDMILYLLKTKYI